MVMQLEAVINKELRKQSQVLREYANRIQSRERQIFDLDVEIKGLEKKRDLVKKRVDKLDGEVDQGLRQVAQEKQEALKKLNRVGDSLADREKKLDEKESGISSSDRKLSKKRGEVDERAEKLRFGLRTLIGQLNIDKETYEKFLNSL